MRVLSRALAVAFVIALTLFGPNAQTAAAAGLVRSISAAGTTSPSARPMGNVAGLQNPELRGGEEEAGATPFAGIVNRESRTGRDEPGEDQGDGRNPGPSATLVKSFNGLNHRDQRTANGGNQFSVEPPDQALCVGAGYVVEAVNTVFEVFNTSGTSLSGVVDLNTFYKYPAQIVRATPTTPAIFGPFITDPVCIYDSGHFVLVILTLDQDPASGAFLGPNHLDIAVSKSSNPLGDWTIYRVPVQNDGTAGTPNHGCIEETDTGDIPGPCIGDYPHMGADANGVFITTNEYDFFGPRFLSANIYAFSKTQLLSGGGSVNVVGPIETKASVHSSKGTQPGFTVWPAISSGGQYESGANGTEYFLSSNAGEEANGVPGGSSSRELIVWALSNTKSLTTSPDLKLRNKVIASERYAIPPKSTQKKGDFPLGQCINDTKTTITSLGPPFKGCWQALFNPPAPPHNMKLGVLDSNDTRMQQVWFADGLLWGALDTAVSFGDNPRKNRAGIAWFIVRPTVTSSNLGAQMKLQGYLSSRNNNLIYPAIAATPDGQGVMAFTLVGDDFYPSSAYVGIDAKSGVGEIQLAKAGAGPQDGFSEYPVFTNRPRWGDYGAAVVVGSSIWIASEYIAQSCDLKEYIAAPFGSCGGTRTALGNWATRISKVTPQGEKDGHGD